MLALPETSGASIPETMAAAAAARDPAATPAHVRPALVHEEVAEGDEADGVAPPPHEAHERSRERLLGASCSASDARPRT